VDKLIIAGGDNPDQFYATGLGLHTFITLVRGKKTYVAAGGFEYFQAAQKYPALRFEDLGADMPSIVKAFIKKYKVKKPLMPASTQAQFYTLVPEAQLVNSVFPERSIKSQTEIKRMQAVQQANEAAILAVREVLSTATIKNRKAQYKGKPLTSEYLKTVAAQTLASYDCSCPEMIISSGKQTALPHDRGSGVIVEGPVIVDIFPQSHTSRYFADCTRTYVIGKAPKTFEERYNAVLAVQRKAKSLVKDGASHVDAETRKLFAELGFQTDLKTGKGYIHSLGHGVGLEIHEERLFRGVLKAGNVLTIEPGLYYDYGIRIEDIGAVTKTSFKNFTRIDSNPYI
jgi:Xaa-Pro aminopeptidase